MLSTHDFPQADKLKQVGDVANAVANNKYSDKEIEQFIGLHSKGRQGRYYRKAAEIVGLISTTKNKSTLTSLGKEFYSLASPVARREFLIRCVLDTALFKEALQYIRVYRPTDRQLKAWYFQAYKGSKDTAARRYITFESYLNEIRRTPVIKKIGEGNILNKFTGLGFIKNKDIKAGISKKNTETPLPISKLMKRDIDTQKLDRANEIHMNLVSAKAEFLNTKNLPAYSNALIDVFSIANKDKIIYEMKSISDTNLISQIRKALAQLYEYRYVFSEPSARLCVVSNMPFGKKYDWLADYLIKDRSIAYEWTKDFKTFESLKGSKNILSQFAP